MEANELRIGNFLSSKQWKGMHEVDGIDLLQTGYRVKLKGFWHEYKAGYYFDIEPIPLSEEILLKCGFEIGYPSYNLDGFELLYNKSIGYRFAQDGQYVSEEIKYIHQLQNLYFALTYKELNTSGL